MSAFRLPRLVVCLCAVLLAACSGQEAALVPTATPLLPSAPPASPTALPTQTVTATPTTTPKPTVTPVPTTTPQPTADPITGAPALARGSVTQRPYIVMIDNHPDAYPQTGMDKAAVVFEALAEFGVTRFMALYAPGITPEVNRIGPVRSTRLYFVNWAMGFHALYAHAGGSPQGLALAESTDQIINLDALRKDGNSFFVRSKDRVAPHNLYTSSAQLERAETAFKGTELADPEIGFLFKPDVAAADRPESSSFSYYFLYPQDPAGWRYDPKTNGYLRLRRGVAARDQATGKQLWAKNVVVMEVPERQIVGDEKGRIEQDVLGEGKARVFEDGTEREVTWRKANATASLRFYEASGDEVLLNAGPVWIVALPSLDNLKS